MISASSVSWIFVSNFFNGICDGFILIRGFFGCGPSGRGGMRGLEEFTFNAGELGREGRTLLWDCVTECLTRGLTASFAWRGCFLIGFISIAIFLVEESHYRWRGGLISFMNLHNYASQKILHSWPSHRISSTYIRMTFWFMPKPMYHQNFKTFIHATISNIHVEHRNLRSSSGGYFWVFWKIK